VVSAPARPVRELLAASSLVAAGGWTVAELLGPRARQALAAEARACHAAGATRAQLDVSPDEDVRRGNPARRLESAPGGAALRALYTAPVLHAWLRELTGLAWVPSGGQGTYSYYRQAHDFLGVHRDIDECDLAVIACVEETGAPASGLAGALSLWPQRTADRLSEIRRHPAPGRVTVRLTPGQSIVLLGGMIAHALEPLAAGHQRVVAPLCFRAAHG
jgi:hypothetical protein